MPSERADTPWLTTEGLAEYLDVSVDTVRAWRYRSVGPPGYRVGRHVRYHRDEVDAWVRSTHDATVASDGPSDLHPRAEG